MISNPAYSALKHKLEKIDAVRQNETNPSGYETPGVFLYKLNSPDSEFSHPGLSCDRQLEGDRLLGLLFGKLDSTEAKTCPCSFKQLNTLIYQRIDDSRIPSGYECYTYEAIPVDKLVVNAKRCCYKIEGGSLVTDPSIVNGLNLIQGYKFSVGHTMYDACCNTEFMQSGALKESQCTEMLKRRPESTCDLFKSSGASKSFPFRQSLHSIAVLVKLV